MKRDSETEQCSLHKADMLAVGPSAFQNNEFV